MPRKHIRLDLSYIIQKLPDFTVYSFVFPNNPDYLIIALPITNAQETLEMLANAEHPLLEGNIGL